jgi:hypothetical protein
MTLQSAGRRVMHDCTCECSPAGLPSTDMRISARPVISGSSCGEAACSIHNAKKPYKLSILGMCEQQCGTARHGAVQSKLMQWHQHVHHRCAPYYTCTPLTLTQPGMAFKPGAAVTVCPCSSSTLLPNSESASAGLAAATTPSDKAVVTMACRLLHDPLLVLHVRGNLTVAKA